MADTWTTLVNRLHMHEHFEEDCPCDGCDAVREAIAIVAAAEAWANMYRREFRGFNSPDGRELTAAEDALLALLPVAALKG